MKFKMSHRYIEEEPDKIFTENDAPDWLTSVKTVKGSTMDNRWFWIEYVLKLKIGESIDTDFQTITRLE